MNVAKLEKYRFLGVDPGTNVLGYAVIEIESKKLHLVEMGVVKLGHLANPHLKLKKIFERLQEVIDLYHPRELAIEAPFFGKNVQSMLKLGRAQGVAMAAGITKGLAITEYSPKKIKQSVTGNGNASKEQVAAMLGQILQEKINYSNLDATDALATAVCHYYQSSSLLKGGKKYGGWSAFINENPDRVK